MFRRDTTTRGARLPDFCRYAPVPSFVVTVKRAASLGGVETLVSLPVHTSHHGFTDEQLRAAGIDAGMVRISLGVEDAADLIADADAALSGV